MVLRDIFYDNSILWKDNKMVSKELIAKINAAYSVLEMKRVQIIHALFNRISEVSSGWYNGHYHESADGEWCMDSYPLSVVTVKGICDIEIDFNTVSVSTKLKRERALKYSYDKISRYDFEAYGVEDYLQTFYEPGNTIEEMKSNISRGAEKEIGFAFSFDFDVDEKTIFEFVKLLQMEGFYY